MQMFDILKSMRAYGSPSAQSSFAGISFGGVTVPQLYNAFIACPTAAITTNCTQAVVSQIVIAHFNLYSGEIDVNINNMRPDVADIYARRLQSLNTAPPGEIDVGTTATEGADLTIAVLPPPYAGTIQTNTLTT